MEEEELQQPLTNEVEESFFFCFGGVFSGKNNVVVK